MENLNKGYPVRKFDGPTRRYCQTLDLRDDPELISEYRRLHSREGIWAETLEAIRQAGLMMEQMKVVRDTSQAAYDASSTLQANVQVS